MAQCSTRCRHGHIGWYTAPSGLFIVVGLQMIKGTITCPPPNSDLKSFDSNIKLEGEYEVQGKKVSYDKVPPPPPPCTARAVRCAVPRRRRAVTKGRGHNYIVMAVPCAVLYRAVAVP